ncbi:hypothetical protein PMAYCL1PPCAC_31629, partial [Pristionchus mayeri]
FSFAALLLQRKYRNPMKIVYEFHRELRIVENSSSNLTWKAVSPAYFRSDPGSNLLKNQKMWKSEMSARVIALPTKNPVPLASRNLSYRVRKGTISSSTRVRKISIFLASLFSLNHGCSLTSRSSTPITISSTFACSQSSFPARSNFLARNLSIARDWLSFCPFTSSTGSCAYGIWLFIAGQSARSILWSSKKSNTCANSNLMGSARPMRLKYVSLYVSDIPT